MEKTLREVCKEISVSRRTIQGYEKAGLVRSSGRNARGYLLYDQVAQERIEKIRMYQEFGFPIKEIGKYIDADSCVLKPVLQTRLDKLKEERARLDRIILKVEKMIWDM